VTGGESRVENRSVPRVMCTERVGGVLAVVVHGRGSGLAWGLSEMQRERDAHVCLIGRAERRGGARDVLSRSLSRAGTSERARFHPRS
jgi:hypothetical protein